MKQFILPQREQATLMPNASFSLPGLFLYSDLLYRCLEEVKEKFDYQILIQYLYGAPRVRWNCGRLMIVDHHFTIDDIGAELSSVAAHGITPLLTFSSPLIRREDLGDPVCNEILSLLEPIHGGVIVSSPLLAAYIRDRYPHVALHASVIMTAFEPHRDVSYYESLSLNYDRYVLHPDDNFRLDLLAEVPKENAEIILNERCGYECAQRKEHYESIAHDQTALIDGSCPLSNFLDHCPYVPDWKQATTKEKNVSLTTPEAVRLSQLGFSLFKLQGRLDSPYVLFFEFFRYALENQVAFPTMFPIFSYAIKDFLKKKKSEPHTPVSG